MEPGSLLMLVVLLGVSYFMLIRPQKKRMAEHTKLLSSVAAGDEVVTIGGMYGFVNRVEDDTIWLEVTEGFEIRFNKSAISKKISSAGVDETEAEPEAEPEQTEPVGAEPEAAEADPST